MIKRGFVLGIRFGKRWEVLMWAYWLKKLLGLLIADSLVDKTEYYPKELTDKWNREEFKRWFGKFRITVEGMPMWRFKKHRCICGAKGTIYINKEEACIFCIKCHNNRTVEALSFRLDYRNHIHTWAIDGVNN